MEQRNNANAKLMWDEDGKLGPTDPNCSLLVLLDWWRVEGNYAAFRGDGNRGIKNKAIAEKLAEEINKVAITNRSSDAV